MLTRQGVSGVPILRAMPRARGMWTQIVVRKAGNGTPVVADRMTITRADRIGFGGGMRMRSRTGTPVAEKIVAKGTVRGGRETKATANDTGVTAAAERTAIVIVIAIATNTKARTRSEEGGVADVRMAMAGAIGSGSGGSRRAARCMRMMRLNVVGSMGTTDDASETFTKDEATGAGSRGITAPVAIEENLESVEGGSRPGARARNGGKGARSIPEGAGNGLGRALSLDLGQDLDRGVVDEIGS